jgi:hypothetical protein
LLKTLKAICKRELIIERQVLSRPAICNTREAS